MNILAAKHEKGIAVWVVDSEAPTIVVSEKFFNSLEDILPNDRIFLAIHPDEFRERLK